MSLLQTDLELTRNSYYAATAPRRQRFAALESDVEADVAIVGGGLAGLSAAVELADRGYRVVLLEARQVGWGASGRNGGQAIAGLACDQAVVEAQLGHGDARRVWDMTMEALRLIGERRERFGIDCDWRPGYLGLAVGERKARELRAWHEQMQRDYGYETRWIEPGEMPAWIASPRFHSGIHDPRGGHLHPLKYSMGLAAAAASLGVSIHEDSAVGAVEHGRIARLRTARGSVAAAHVLLAGNVYLQGLAPALEARVMPVGTYIVASEPLAPALAESLIPSGSAVCDTNFVLDYFRPTVDRRLLYGGRVSYSTATPVNLVASMRRRMARTFPQLADTKVEFAWGGFVDISMNRAPDFGRLADAPNVYYLQGFSGHGLALTGLAGKLVAEAIAGDAGRFDTFARIRHRPFPGGSLLRTPALVAGMAYYRLRDLL
ncbi:NAD(P)/FAD-dependent oxidoreductase [Piscinibacter sp.]|uniref:NAD(P)/FAD-dependent oxidoreductase n=1 Tax=Piscinibacter sp. TaxID=1903157 RepID=UPI0039E328DC